MPNIQDIFNAISTDDFSSSTLQLIDKYTNDIQNGTTNFYRFTIPEHAGLCTAGPALIGASVIASYARASLTASRNASGSQRSPNSWEIDELQEQLIEKWAKASHLWVDDSDKILTATFGPMIAQGAEAKVYYREGDTSVVKERASIYSTTQKALDAIVLHNCLFPETAMHVVGFTRDADRLLRMILTQPYVRCLRLATKEEIDELAFSKGFRDNWSGQGVNYISDRIALEDMHPANVFVDEVSAQPICIDLSMNQLNVFKMTTIDMYSCFSSIYIKEQFPDKECKLIVSVQDTDSLLQAVDTAVTMNANGDHGIPVPDYVDENVSTKVVKIIQSYTGIVNKMVWRKN